MIFPSCYSGSTAGCHNLGVLYQRGLGVNQDDSKAKELYKKACDGKLQEGCEGLNSLNKFN